MFAISMIWFRRMDNFGKTKPNLPLYQSTLLNRGPYQSPPLHQAPHKSSSLHPSPLWSPLLTSGFIRAPLYFKVSIRVPLLHQVPHQGPLEPLFTSRAQSESPFLSNLLSAHACSVAVVSKAAGQEEEQVWTKEVTPPPDRKSTSSVARILAVLVTKWVEDEQCSGEKLTLLGQAYHRLLGRWLS